MLNNSIMSNINWQTKTISFNTIYKSSNVQKCHICVDIMIIPSTMYNIAHTFNTDANLCTFSPEMHILIQIPYFIDFAINCHNNIPLLCIFARSFSWDTRGGGGGTPYIIHIHMWCQNAPLFDDFISRWPPQKWSFTLNRPY